MKFETIEVSGFKGALWGMRLPMSKDLDDAKSKSDSSFPELVDDEPVIGTDDLKVAQNRIKADDAIGKTGQPESKFLRMIHVQVGITAPLYFWQELDTYKVGTVANSTSKMHKLSSYPITKESFEMDDFAESVMIEDNSEDRNDVNVNCLWENFIYCLEQLRETYNETKDKRYWKELLRMLPDSYLQTRVFDCNYEVLRNICCWRENHKLNEWSGKDNPSLNNFIAWAKTLPYADELIFYKGGKEC